jgi:hypothetical protein
MSSTPGAATGTLPPEAWAPHNLLRSDSLRQLLLHLAGRLPREDWGEPLDDDQRAEVERGARLLREIAQGPAKMTLLLGTLMCCVVAWPTPGPSVELTGSHTRQVFQYVFPVVPPGCREMPGWLTAFALVHNQLTNPCPTALGAEIAARLVGALSSRGKT